MSTRPARRGPSDDTLDAVLAAVLAAAVFALVFLAGVWATEAHAERMSTTTTTTTER